MLNIVIELDEMHDINSLINIQSIKYSQLIKYVINNFQNREIW